MSKRLPPGLFRPMIINNKTGERRETNVIWCRYSHNGKQYRESTKSTRVADATNFLRKRLGETGSGKFIGPTADKLTFAQLAEMLLTYLKNNGCGVGKRHTPLEHARRFWGDDFLVRDITTVELNRFVAFRKDEGAANASINRSLSAVRKAINLAVESDLLARAPKFPMLKEDNRRKGFFELDELHAVCAELPISEDEVSAFAARRRQEGMTPAQLKQELAVMKLSAPAVRPVLEVAYITGWRIKSELLTRKRSHVDLENGVLRLEPGESKNGEGRNFHLTPRLRAILTAQLERTRQLEKETGAIIPWLFHRGGKQMKGFRRAWTTARKRAGVPEKILHDFRRTAVRNLERAGVPRSAAMEMVGHRTESIYLRYAITDATMLKEAAVKLAAQHDFDEAASVERKRRVITLVR
jgi:integrase